MKEQFTQWHAGKVAAYVKNENKDIVDLWISIMKSCWFSMFAKHCAGSTRNKDMLFLVLFNKIRSDYHVLAIYFLFCFNDTNRKVMAISQ